MELDCRGCAGCCLDWRPLVEDGAFDRGAEDGIDDDHSASRRGPYPSLDGTYNLVPLERDEVRAFVDAGLGDVLTPRLWAAGPDDPHVEVGDHRVAAVAGHPAFFVGLRKPPKPVAPFGHEAATWLPTCVFLDPTTLQCRIHEDELYPAECGAYPAHNLALGQQTECERVEAATGDERLSSVDDERLADLDDRLLLGPQAVGGKVFCHPRPSDIRTAVDRLAAGAATRADRAEFVAVAAASSPGTLAISEPHYERALERAESTSSWAGEAIAEWERLASDSDRSAGETVEGPSETRPNGREATAQSPDPSLAERVEVDRGAPATPGWPTKD